MSWMATGNYLMQRLLNTVSLKGLTVIELDLDPQIVTVRSAFILHL